MGAVVRRERQDPELGQLAVADLVRDLAGLHVALRVVVGGLQLGQAAQRSGGELRVAARSPCIDTMQRVAAEQGHEPRDAGRRDEDATLEGRVLEAERLHVADGLVPRPADARIAGLDADAAAAGRRMTCRSAAPRDRVAVERRRPARASAVTGSHFRQVCQTPLAAIVATKMRRPLAYWGGVSGALRPRRRARAGSRGCVASCAAPRAPGPAVSDGAAADDPVRP